MNDGACLLAGQVVANNSILLSNAASVPLRPRVAGLLTVQAMLTVNGTTYISQGSISVRPGRLALNKTEVFGPGLGGAVVGKTAAIFVQLFDAWGDAVVSKRWKQALHRSMSCIEILM